MDEPSNVILTQTLECKFLMHSQILVLDDFVKLNEDRALTNAKLTDLVISQDELLHQITVELNFFRLCKNTVTTSENHLDVIQRQTLSIIANRISRLFQYMHVLFTIRKKLLSSFIELCQDNVAFFNVNQLDFLVDVVLRSNNSKDIWIILELYLKFSDKSKLLYVFQEVVQRLKENSLPLWLKMIDENKQNPDTMEKLFEEGSRLSYTNISLEIRPKYLKWCKDYKGIDATRNLFLKLKDLKPPSIKLYKTMISIEYFEFECMQTNYDKNILRNIFVNLCNLFGKDNVGVWIDYIKFEHIHGSKEIIGSIFSFALVYLKSNLRDSLDDEFNKLKNELKYNLYNGVIVIDDD